MRTIILAAMLSCFVVGTSSARGQSTDGEFLAGLRERGLFELAERHCADLLTRPRISEAERADLAVELLRTLVAHAAATRPANRDALWQKARAAAADFERRWPGHPRLVLVRLQDALAPLTQGELARQEFEAGLLPPDQLDQPRTTLREAIDLLQAIDKELIRDIPLRRRTPAKADDLTADELEALQRDVRYHLARASRNRALLFNAGSDDRVALLSQAREILQQLVASLGDDPPRAQTVRLELAECLRLMSRLDESAAVLDELEGAAEPNIALRLRAHRLQLALAQSDVAEMKRLVAEERSIGGQGAADLDFARLQAHLALARAAAGGSDNSAERGHYDAAAEAADHLRRSGNEYWLLRAGRLLATDVPEGAGSENVPLLALRAESLFLSKDFAAALAAYDAAAGAARKSGDQQAAFELAYKAALVAQKQNEPGEASRRFCAVAKAHPDHPQAPAAHLLGVWHAGRLAKATAAAADTYPALLHEHLATWPHAESAAQVRLWLARLAQSRGQ